MTTKNPNHLVKDDFRHVTFWNGEEITLCTDCQKELQQGIQLAIIATPYEEVQCDQCSCMNSVAAYVDEIEISITRDKKRKLERTVSKQRTQKQKTR